MGKYTWKLQELTQISICNECIHWSSIKSRDLLRLRIRFNKRFAHSRSQVNNFFCRKSSNQIRSWGRSWSSSSSTLETPFGKVSLLYLPFLKFKGIHSQKREREENSKKVCANSSDWSGRELVSLCVHRSPPFVSLNLLQNDDDLPLQASSCRASSSIMMVTA